jgi:hypothetical protein
LKFPFDSSGCILITGDCIVVPYIYICNSTFQFKVTHHWKVIMAIIYLYMFYLHRTIYFSSRKSLVTFLSSIYLTGFQNPILISLSLHVCASILQKNVIFWEPLELLCRLK